MSQTVAIFGATGAQGQPVVRQALSAGMKVRAIARSPKDRIKGLHPRAEALSVDLTGRQSLRLAMDGVDAAFVHLPMQTGPDDARIWLETLLAAARDVSLPLLVYTTSGPAGPRFPSSMTVDGITAAMTAVRQSGIPAIVLQPAIYLENLLPEIFLPRLRREGILDYPPFPPELKVTWTSHLDQARIAVAALSRPDLAGTSHEIGSHMAVTGPELALMLAERLGRPVRFEPLSPAEFGDRVGQAIGSPGAAYALADLYGALASMENGAMTIDTKAVEAIFGVSLQTIADHIGSWESF